jgi:hypothetical protein
MSRACFSTPVLDDVESCISFDVDDDLCSAVAKNPVDPTASKRTHYTIKFFKLNKCPRLFKLSFEAVNKAFGALEVERAGRMAQVKSYLDKLT